MATTRVTINGQALAELAVNPNGPVMTDLLKRGLRVQTRAKQLCPVDEGRLRSSIQIGFGSDSRGRFVKIGTDVDYAIYVHEGTRPHFPPVLALGGWANRHGINAFLVARAISRHGTRPHPFLRDALPAAAGAG